MLRETELNTTPDLFYRQIGQGFPCVVLHGLYGSSDNWLTVARLLQQQLQLTLVDLPNHGQSFHSNNFDYHSISRHILHLINKLKIHKPILIGHSLGGKIAMNMAKINPEKYTALVILDISPQVYTSDRINDGLLNHQQICTMLLSVNLNKYNHRNDVANELMQKLEDVTLCKFLLKNLARNKTGKFYWRININSILTNQHYLHTAVYNNNDQCLLPTLFIKSSLSNYINDNDKEAIARFFPKSQLIELPDSQHWLHAMQPHLLANSILSYLSRII